MRGLCFKLSLCPWLLTVLCTNWLNLPLSCLFCRTLHLDKHEESLQRVYRQNTGVLAKLYFALKSEVHYISLHLTETQNRSTSWDPLVSIRTPGLDSRRMREKKQVRRKKDETQGETNEGGKRDYPGPWRIGKDGREEERDDERREKGELRGAGYYDDR